LLVAGLAGAPVSLYALIRSARGVLASLRESEERFRALTELSADWYWQRDQKLRFVDVSTGLVRKLCIRLEGATGYTLRETSAELTSAEQRSRLDRLMSRREVFRDVVLECRADDGTVRAVAISGMPLLDDSGVFRGYRGIGRDITEHERMRAAWRSALVDVSQKPRRGRYRV
jgi:PAS domain S-box-containing protein